MSKLPSVLFFHFKGKYVLAEHRVCCIFMVMRRIPFGIVLQALHEFGGEVILIFCIK